MERIVFIIVCVICTVLVVFAQARKNERSNPGRTAGIPGGKKKNDASARENAPTDGNKTKAAISASSEPAKSADTVADGVGSKGSGAKGSLYEQLEASKKKQRENKI